MNKQYIFFTTGIKDLGGVELYLLNKCSWLIENKWDVHIFSATYTKEKYKLESLEKYRNEVIPIMEYTPYECSTKVVKKTIKQILNKLIKDFFAEEIIIESHSGNEALWAELIASKIHGSHFITLLHESFNDACYITKKDFFLYKLNHQQIYAGQICRQNLIIKKWGEDGSKLIQNKIQYNPVLDINDERLEMIKKADYTICYIGRTEKPYFDSIINAVSKFSNNHLDKKIQVVILGDKKNARKSIDLYCKSTKNLSVVLIGDMCPIPKKLYELVDCVCAGSGSARCSVFEGVPVIIPDPITKLANGVLGYDTKETIIPSPDFAPIPFEDEFESVLIRKDYLKKDFSFPKPLTVNEACEYILESFKKCSFFNKNYYYDEKKLMTGKASVKRKTLAYIVSIFPHFLYYKRKFFNRWR